MTNNRKMDCVISGKGLKLNLEFKADEISFRSTSKRFGDNAKYNKTNFEAKNVNLSLSTSEDEFEFELDLNIFLEGIEEAFNKASKPVTAPTQAPAPSDVVQVQVPDVVRIPYFEKELSSKELEKINILVKERLANEAKYLSYVKMETRLTGLSPQALLYLDTLLRRIRWNDSNYECPYPDIKMRQLKEKTLDEKIKYFKELVTPITPSAL